MKRLFKIMDRETNKQATDDFYSNKIEAKKTRDELNGPPLGAQLGTQRRFYISPGPDHHNSK